MAKKCMSIIRKSLSLILVLLLVASIMPIHINAVLADVAEIGATEEVAILGAESDLIDEGTEFDLAESSANNSIGTAIAISTNTTYTDNLSSSSEVDYYKFTTTGATKVSINFQHAMIDSSYNYWYADLLDTNSNRLVRLEVKGNNSNCTSANVGIPAGTYYIKIDSANYSNFDYTFKVNCSTESYWETEINNTMSDADSLSMNNSFHGSLAYSSDVDYYKFTISSPSKVNINFQHDIIDSSYNYWYADLLDTSSNRLVRLEVVGNKTNSTSANVGIPAGTYYIKIDSANYSNFDYTFKVNCSTESYWETENNNSMTNADSLSMNNSFHGSLAYSSDVDYYKFTISSPSKVNINFQHDIIDSSYNYWYADLLDTSSNRLVRLEAVGNNTNSTSANVGIPAGTYYIKVDSANYSNFDYTFKVNCSTESYWETENNNSMTNADSININNYYYGSLAYSSDVDYYSFVLSSSAKCSIGFQHDTIDSSYNYWYADLLDTNSNRKIRLESKGNQTNAVSDDVTLSAGTYYIKITSANYSGKDYKFIVNGPANPSLTLSKSSLSLYVGDTSSITATTTPSGQSVTWTSSNTTVATVSSSGLVTAKAVGSATITAKFAYNGTTYSKTCSVTVIPNPSYSITFSPSSISTYVGSSYKVNITFTGDGIYDLQALGGDTSIFSASWGSIDYSKGTTSITITGKKAGSSSLAIHLRNSSGTSLYSKSFSINVIQPTLTLPSSLNLSVGETSLITANVVPDNASIIWASTNANVASVSNGVVTAIATGSANIVANMTVGGVIYNASCLVTVSPKPSISISNTSLSVNIGDTTTLTATTTPSGQTVTWTSSNQSIAVVANGVITAKAEGTTTITAKFTYGGTTYSTTCSVTVLPDPVSPTNANIKVSKVKGTVGKTVDVPISLSNNPGIVAMTLSVSYNTSALKLVNVKDAGVLGSSSHKPEYSSPYTLSWANDTATSNYTVNGTIATLTFEIKDGASVGNYPITITYDYNNYGIYDKDLNRINFSIENGAVQVINVVYGDVDGNGIVNNLDRVYLTRYLANWNDYQSIDLNAADVNCDGTVNNLDRVILTRYLANWSAYSTLPYEG